MRVLAGLAATASLSACSLPYYWQAVGGQVELLTSRTPIERALEDEALEPEARHVLRHVPGILEFASERLGLPSDGSYRSYVELDRPYVVWNVVAAEEFSTEPVRWCFPVAGCVAYRGYFDRMDAVEFRDELDADGLDTFLGGATAYSTLGYFNDPVLSTMLADGTNTLAALLFHELAHQKVYVRGDSEFNEAYAVAMEEHGMTLWLTERADEEALAAYEAGRARRDEFAALVVRQQERLDEVYRGEAGSDAKRRGKREAFERLREEYAELKRRWGGSTEYDAWFESDLNNASLAAVATYRHWLPAFRARLAEVGLETFQSDVEHAADLEPEERNALLERWRPGTRASRAAPAR